MLHENIWATKKKVAKKVPFISVITIYFGRPERLWSFKYAGEDFYMNCCYPVDQYNTLHLSNISGMTIS